MVMLSLGFPGRGLLWRKGAAGPLDAGLETGVFSVLTAQSWVVQITYQVDSSSFMNPRNCLWVGMTRTGIT